MFVPLYDHNPLEHVRRPYVNWALILVTALVWLVVESPAGFGALAGAAYGYGLTPAVLLGDLRPYAPSVLPEWTSLVTYAFVHADLWHLLGNLVFLWVFGDNVEDAMGHLRYLAFYLVSAVAAGLFHAVMMPASDGPLVGASGAIAAVVAAYLVLHPRTKLWILAFGRIPLRISARWPLAIWVATQFVSVFTGGDEPVGWYAHVGGLVTGAVLILVMRRPGVPLFDRGLAPEGRS